jgi:hypothetical protein
MPYDINIDFEDDYPGIAFWGADRAYTAGWRVSVVSGQPQLPYWLRPVLGWFTEPDSDTDIGFSLGQQIYTPTDLSNPNLITDDEPYAGYLYAGLGVGIRNGDTLHRFELDVGVVGPPSLAAQTQIDFHRIFGFEPVEGWDNQLHTEPALTLYYQRMTRLLSLALPNGRQILDFTPYGEAAIGNVYDYVGVGAQLRLGYGFSNDFGPTVLTPVGGDTFVSSSQPSKRDWWEIYAFGAVEGRAMLRNIFLDGNTFQSSASIDKETFVRDFDFGILMRLGSWRLTWREIGRGQEFTPESGPHPFASISLSYTYVL